MSVLKRLYDFEKYGKELKEGREPGYLQYEEEEQTRTIEDAKDSMEDEMSDEEILSDVDSADEVAKEQEQEESSDLDFGATEDTVEQMLKKLDFVQGIMSQYKKYLNGENIKIDDATKKKIDSLYKAATS